MSNLEDLENLEDLKLEIDRLKYENECQMHCIYFLDFNCDVDFTHPITLRDYWIMQQADDIDAPFKSFVKCLIDLGYLDSLEFYSDYLYLDQIETTELSDTHNWFINQDMKTYITRTGVFELSGIIRYHLLHDKTYARSKKRKKSIKR